MHRRGGQHGHAGQRARIEALQGNASLVQRLLEMGLLEGETIEVLGFAPLGDPMEIRLRDYRLSLRRCEAARIDGLAFTHGDGEGPRRLRDDPNDLVLPLQL